MSDSQAKLTELEHISDPLSRVLVRTEKLMRERQEKTNAMIKSATQGKKVSGK